MILHKFDFRHLRKLDLPVINFLCDGATAVLCSHMSKLKRCDNKYGLFQLIKFCTDTWTLPERFGSKYPRDFCWHRFEMQPSNCVLGSRHIVQCDAFGKELLKEEAPFIYQYKRYIPICILGQVDDLIGITEAGFKAIQMNSYPNVKTLDKYLQFGQNKCVKL